MIKKNFGFLLKLAVWRAINKSFEKKFMEFG